MIFHRAKILTLDEVQFIKFSFYGFDGYKAIQIVYFILIEFW